MKYRIHLRHTGSDKPSFRINPMWSGWRAGFNIAFGYWFLAIRRRRPNEVKRPLVEFSFGKSQQRNIRMRKSSWFKHGEQDAARWIIEGWIYEQGLTEENRHYLEVYNLYYENDRVLPLRLDKIKEKK